MSLLLDRIPRSALVQQPDNRVEKVVVDDRDVGARVLVRHGEVLPIHGDLLSDRALVDESSLTGEPYLLDNICGDPVQSGTVSQSGSLWVSVTEPARDSTYRQILALSLKPPMTVVSGIWAMAYVEMVAADSVESFLDSHS